MKILMVGSDHVWSIERIYYKWLLYWQQEVQLFPAQNEFYAYYQRSLLNKLIYRAGLSRIIPRINAHLRDAVARFRPDAVLVFKGMEVQPATLKWLREQGIFLANFNPDNPFVFSGAGSANLTYLVRFGDRRYVVRRPPFGVLAPGAHDMKREYRALSRLWAHFPRAPRGYLFWVVLSWSVLLLMAIGQVWRLATKRLATPIAGDASSELWIDSRASKH